MHVLERQSYRDPIWAPVLIPAALLPIQLPACSLGKQLRTAQSLGALDLRGSSSGLDWLSSNCCGQLGDESSDTRPSSLYT